MSEQWGVEILSRDFGDEAEVSQALAWRFPGVGGTIVTEHAVLTAIRQEFSASLPGHAKTIFDKHAIIKKLDDYFHRSGKYKYQHIPRPLGSATILQDGGKTRETYFYQWAYGSEGFPWFCPGTDSKRMPVELDEWNKFVSCFYEAGIDLSYDCRVTDGESSKNIIHEAPDGEEARSRFNCLWKRIDFGSRSMIFKPDVCAKFIRDSREKLIRAFGASGLDRYEMMELGLRYIGDGALDAHSMGRLEILTRNYRLSTLRDHVASFLGENTDDPFVLCIPQENGESFSRHQ